MKKLPNHHSIEDLYIYCLLISEYCNDRCNELEHDQFTSHRKDLEYDAIRNTLREANNLASILEDVFMDMDENPKYYGNT